MPRTLYDKIWDAHCVAADGDDTLIYIDRHLIHEVTSPQAFAGLRDQRRSVLRPAQTLAFMDHCIPTAGRELPIADEMARRQVEALAANCCANGIRLYDLKSESQGIVHVVAPELGAILPGMTVVCGDSHTSTLGALGALAFGIGTSEIEHVLATQTLRQKKSRNMLVAIEGALAKGVTAKDVVLALIGTIGVDGGTGHVIEYRGKLVESLSVEGRMTLCNMTIEAGAKAGIVAPDARLFEYLHGRALSPKGGLWEQAQRHWQALRSDPDASFDRIVRVDGSMVKPQVSWGTTPDQVAPVDGAVPLPERFAGPARRAAYERALDYMGLAPGTPIRGISVDCVFIGSCTNSRIEDLRDAADVLEGRRIKPGLRAIVVPGSKAVAREAAGEGLRDIFLRAGFEWREPGCSMCVGINGDIVRDRERCASTSNRNFEGRQGRGARTHLVSPRVAGATAVAGHFLDPASL
jgi:3-isopropylmalate/(R)-2-methylmalate dehydratase large subunit